VPQPATKKGRAGKRILVGCLIFLGVGVLLVLGLVLAGGYWFTKPGHQVPTLTVVSPQSVGQVHVFDLGADSGTRELLREFLQASQRANAEPSAQMLPEWLKRRQSLQAAQSSEQLELWLPSEVTLSVEPAAGDDAWIAAVNFKRFVRPIAALIELTLRN